jgi:hypothetical protein
MTEFKGTIRSMKWHADEENFDEAIALVPRLYKKSGVPDEIQKLFDDPQCENVNSSVRILSRSVLF